MNRGISKTVPHIRKEHLSFLVRPPQRRSQSPQRKPLQRILQIHAIPQAPLLHLLVLAPRADGDLDARFLDIGETGRGNVAFCLLADLERLARDVAEVSEHFDLGRKGLRVAFTYGAFFGLGS